MRQHPPDELKLELEENLQATYSALSVENDITIEKRKDLALFAFS